MILEFLRTIADQTVVVGIDTAQAYEKGNIQKETPANTHEGCNRFTPFDPDEEVDWGVMTVCPTDINYIYMEGRLEFWHTGLGSYIQIDFVDETCATYVCISNDTCHKYHVGDYRVKHCYTANSDQSSFAWSYD